MAGRGPAPKDPAQRRRQPTKGAEPPRRTLSAPPAAHPPLPGAARLGAATRRWYRTWSSSPQASRFLPTDWQRLHMLAPLVDRYFAEPDKGLMAEIRINEASLGATEADRLRLRWDVELPKPPAGPAAGDKAREGRILRLARDT